MSWAVPSGRWNYAIILYLDKTATVDDLREAVTMLESITMSYKRVYGVSHPETSNALHALANARATLARASK